MMKMHVKIAMICINFSSECYIGVLVLVNILLFHFNSYIIIFFLFRTLIGKFIEKKKRMKFLEKEKSSKKWTGTCIITTVYEKRKKREIARRRKKSSHPITLLLWVDIGAIFFFFSIQSILFSLSLSLYVYVRVLPT